MIARHHIRHRPRKPSSRGRTLRVPRDPPRRAADHRRRRVSHRCERPRARVAPALMLIDVGRGYGRACLALRRLEDSDDPVYMDVRRRDDPVYHRSARRARPFRVYRVRLRDRVAAARQARSGTFPWHNRGGLMGRFVMRDALSGCANTDMCAVRAIRRDRCSLLACVNDFTLEHI